jgi:hypothetical protein
MFPAENLAHNNSECPDMSAFFVWQRFPEAVATLFKIPRRVKFVTDFRGRLVPKRHAFF